MEELFKIIDRMIKQSAKIKSIEFNSQNIKECLFLLENGWKIINYKGVPKSLKISVIFKNENQEKSIELTLSEQKLWMMVMQKREELRKNVKSI